MRDMLLRLERKTKIIGRSEAPSLVKSNVEVYKWYMDHQLTQVDNYLAYLQNALKQIPENQAIVLHQYSLDPKQKPAGLDISNHIKLEKMAGPNHLLDIVFHPLVPFSGYHVKKLLCEFEDKFVLLSDNPPAACIV